MRYINYIFAITLLGLWESQASFGLENIDDGLIGSFLPLEVTIQTYISLLLGFLYLIAVIMIIWSGFRILTAAGDDDQVSKAKTMIIYALAGIVIIFLAGSLVQLIMESIFWATPGI